MDPSPSVDRTVMPPAIRLASSRQIARPSPVPPKLRVVDTSAWVNGAKMLSAASAAIPTPVSVTWKASRIRPGAAGAVPTSTVTCPAGVNFTALDSRLTRICRNRTGSPSTVTGVSGANSAASASLFSSAFGAMMPTASSTHATRSKGMISRSSRPDSILDRSRMSSITPRRWSPAARISSAYSACSASSAVSSSRLVKPMTALSGERISWLMLARNAAFAPLACSAAARACSSRSLCSDSSA